LALGYQATACLVPGGDVFVHVSNLTNGGSDDMVVGAEMTFDIEEAAHFFEKKMEDRVVVSNHGHFPLSMG